MKSSNSTLVYSTDGGRMCPNCTAPLAQCSCADSGRILGDGFVRVARETKGRGGKCVTLVRGVALDAASLATLGKSLRAACGTGGTVKDGVIEVQGDHCDRVMAVLQNEGYQPKRTGR